MPRSIGDELEYSKSALEVLVRLLEDTRFPLDRRTLLAHSYLAVAREHQESIIVLVSLQLSGSARALFRPLLETVFRGLWVMLLANENQMEQVISDSKGAFPKLGDLAAELDANIPGNTYFSAVAQGWSYYCSLAHTGAAQLRHQVQPDGTVNAIYPWTEIKWTIRTSATLVITMAQTIFMAMSLPDKVTTLSDFVVANPDLDRESGS